jgi:hypothetical protein
VYNQGFDYLLRVLIAAKNQVNTAIKMMMGIGMPRNHKRIERIVFLLSQLIVTGLLNNGYRSR